MLVVEFCFIFGDCLFIHSFFIYTLYICHLFYSFMLTGIVSSLNICIQKKKKKIIFVKMFPKTFPTIQGATITDINRGLPFLRLRKD